MSPQQMPRKGLVDLHLKWRAVIDYCRERASEDCRTILQLMEEADARDSDTSEMTCGPTDYSRRAMHSDASGAS